MDHGWLDNLTKQRYKVILRTIVIKVWYLVARPRTSSLLHRVGVTGRGGGGACSGSAVFLTELEGKNLLDVGTFDDGLGNVPHGAAQGRGACQVGRLWICNEVRE